MAANGVSGPHGIDRTGPPDTPAAAVDLSKVTFGDVLRAINPLQYLPVVGTIYRVATGDTASPGLRTAVSAVVGTLTGGPLGLLTSIAGSLAEQFLHLDARLHEAFAPHIKAPEVRVIEAGTAEPVAAGAAAANAYIAAGLLRLG